MDPVVNLLSFIILIFIVLSIAVFRSGVRTLDIKGKIKHSQKAPWSLNDFINQKSKQIPSKTFFRFSEQSVISHSHKYNGRFDQAVLHWENAPVLDVIIEHKFPVNNLPNIARKQDLFQAGLYALALAESGVSCEKTVLMVTYCLQDVAKRCLKNNVSKACWDCGESNIFSKRFNRQEIEKILVKIAEVWYEKRPPRPNPSENTCRQCPFRKSGRCNYSAV